MCEGKLRVLIVRSLLCLMESSLPSSKASFILVPLLQVKTRGQRLSRLPQATEAVSGVGRILPRVYVTRVHAPTRSPAPPPASQ